MRIATFNIYWYGTSRASIVARSADDEALVGRVVAGIDADVLALQEICSRAALADLLARASAETGRRYVCEQAGEWVCSARPGSRDATDQGVQKVVIAWDANTMEPESWGQVPGPALRPAVTARFAGLTIATAHLKSGLNGAPMSDPAAQQRHLEAALLADWAGTVSGPCAVLGDFNARAGDPSVAPLDTLPGWWWPTPATPPEDAWTAWYDRAMIDRIGANFPLATRVWAWDRDPRFNMDFHEIGTLCAQRVRDVPAGPVENLYRVSDHRPVILDL